MNIASFLVLMLLPSALPASHVQMPVVLSVTQEDAVDLTVQREAEQMVGQTVAIANGRMVVIRQPSPSESTETSKLMIHFHGAIPTARKALAHSTFNGTLVIVNFPGLSSAYAQPFEDNPQLFEQILLNSNSSSDSHILLSSFSAGYGAIRQILKSPKYFDQIHAIVLADSIYAGLDAEKPKRRVSQANMQDFQRFADLASTNQKTFVLSHSAQPTPYASTTETSNYLLASLRIDRIPSTTIQRANFCQSTSAKKGQFTVLGFDGETGQHHMQHLHNIDALWNIANSQ